MRSFNYLLLSLLVFIITIACSADETVDNHPVLDFSTVMDSTNISYTVEGLSGPEAVRYDPANDVFYISNFNGGGNERDENGFITRVNAETGTTESLKFMTGTEEAPLHAPRGMFITGDTLYVADIDGVHLYNTGTGRHISFVDFGAFEPGFLNDVVLWKANLYVTDTGKNAVYVIRDNLPVLLTDSLPISPNGITLSPDKSSVILAPWGGDSLFYSINLEEEIQIFDTLKGGYFDGLEYVEGKLLTASQADPAIRVYTGSSNDILIHTPGRPADIGIDTKRNRILVPYIALNRVDVWEINTIQKQDE